MLFRLQCKWLQTWISQGIHTFTSALMGCPPQLSLTTQMDLPTRPSLRHSKGCCQPVLHLVILSPQGSHSLLSYVLLLLPSCSCSRSSIPFSFSELFKRL